MESKQLKQWNSDPQIQPPLGFFGLLRESFKTIKRNGKLLLQVLVVIIVLFSLLDFAQNYLLDPLLKDLASKLEQHPKQIEVFFVNSHQTDYSGALNDIRRIIRVCILTLILSAIISLDFFVATVSSSSEAYAGKVQNLQEIVPKLRKSYKKIIVTSFYMILISMGYVVVVVFSIGLISILFVDSWASNLLYGVVFLSIIVLWIYVSALWMMSLVVSVLEGVGGLEAIASGNALMKGGKVKALVLMVLFSVAYIVLHSITSRSQKLEKWPGMVIWIVLSNALLCGLKVVVFVVFTVFYHQQKENILDKKAAKSLYQSVVGDEV